MKYRALPLVLALLWAAPNSARAARPLPPADSGDLRAFVAYSVSYYPRYTTNFNFLLLSSDGTAFRDVPHKPTPRFDAATLRRTLDAGDVGRWKQSGSTLLLTFPSTSLTLHKYPQGWREKPLTDKESAYDTFYPITPPARQALLGVWKSSSLVTYGTNGGGAPMVAAGSNGDLVLRADGTFTSAEASFTSATTANVGDAYKGDGDVYAEGKNRAAAAGRWRLDGFLLTTEANGNRTVRLAFFMPHWSRNGNPQDMMLNDDRWKRPEKR